MMNIRSFTLIEMLIVIVVAAILMMMVMQFGGQFVRDIQARQLRETWVSDMTALRGKLLLSRYDDGLSISGVNLSFSDGNIIQRTTYTDGPENTTTHSYHDMTLSGDNFSLVPYQLACDSDDIAERTVELTFARSEKEYCYTIEHTTCTLVRETCAE